MGHFRRFFARCLLSAFTLNSNIGNFCSRFWKNFQNLKIVWTRRMQFWQPCRDILARRPRVFRSKSENVTKIVFFQKKLFFRKVFLWTRRMQFWRHRRKIFDTRPRVFRWVSENDFKNFLRRFPQNVFMDT